MRMRLVARNEVAGNPNMQMTFQQDVPQREPGATPAGPGAGVAGTMNYTGWMRPEEAKTYEVDAVYELTLERVVEG